MCIHLMKFIHIQTRLYIENNRNLLENHFIVEVLSMTRNAQNAYVRGVIKK